MDEVELVKQMQQGSQEAFAEIFELYKARALRTIYLIIGNAYTSEDVAQEVFIKCYLQCSKLKDPTLFKPWFYKILTRTAWQYCKMEKRVVPVDEIFEHLEEREETEDNVMHALLQEEIEKLPVKQKTVLILYYYNDLTIKEISKATGLFEGTVKSRLHRAKKQLQEQIVFAEGKEGAGAYG